MEARESYRGKEFTIPQFSNTGWHYRPNSGALPTVAPVLRHRAESRNPIMVNLNEPFNLENFKIARKPISIGHLDESELIVLSNPGWAPRTLDMPIKFPGSDFRLPKELSGFQSIVKRVANWEAQINPDCYDEYYCYLTIDAGVVKPGTLQREAPCHVDGFQGARWQPKVRGNHTYTVSNLFPTAYYVQPFDFSGLDEAKHDFFWEMNRQVAETNSAYAWQPEDGEITLMDCYCVHRGTEAYFEAFRTFVRLSFEVRIFDRLGNAHNPMFKYDWPMVPRDIEALNLVAFDPECDPSLRVFPWQGLDGKGRAEGTPKTKPNLKPNTRGNVASGDVIKADDSKPRVYPRYW